MEAAILLTVAVVAIGALGLRVALAPRVLLVANPRSAEWRRLAAALEDAGFAVRGCAGPSFWGCPLLKGEGCPVLGRHLAVVASHPPDYTGPAPLCGLALGVPQLTIEADSDTKPTFGSRAARVGSAHGPSVAVGMLPRLLEDSGART